MDEIGNLLTNSNIVGEKFNLNILSIKLISDNENTYTVSLLIDENPARKWSIEIPKNIDFIKTIRCNYATQDVTKEEFEFYRRMTHVAYALSVYFIDVKNDMEKGVLSENAFSGDEFYEYVESLLKQIHCEITKRESSTKSKL